MKNAEEGIFPGLWSDCEIAAQQGTHILQTDDANAFSPERCANSLITAEVPDLREILPIQGRGDHAEGVIGACNDRELLLPISTTIAISQVIGK